MKERKGGERGKYERETKLGKRGEETFHSSVELEHDGLEELHGGFLEGGRGWKKEGRKEGERKEPLDETFFWRKGMTIAIEC